MATEILNFAAKDAAPGSNQSTATTVAVHSGSLVPQVDDLVIVFGTYERSSSGPMPSTSNGDHPTTGHTFTCRNLDTSSLFTATGWVDLGFARGGNGNQQGSIAFGKYLTSTDFRSTGSAGAPSLVCQIVGSNTCRGSHARMIIVRGASATLSDIADISKSSVHGVNDTSTEACFWNQPSDGTYVGTATGMDNPLIVSWGGWRRAGSDLVTISTAGDQGETFVLPASAVLNCPWTLTVPPSGNVSLLDGTTNVDYGSGTTFKGIDEVSGSGCYSLLYFEKHGSFSSANTDWGTTDNYMGWGTGARVNGFAGLSVVIPETVASQSYTRSVSSSAAPADSVVTLEDAQLNDIEDRVLPTDALLTLKGAVRAPSSSATPSSVVDLVKDSSRSISSTASASASPSTTAEFVRSILSVSFAEKTSVDLVEEAARAASSVADISDAATAVKTALEELSVSSGPSVSDVATLVKSGVRSLVSSASPASSVVTVKGAIILVTSRIVSISGYTSVDIVAGIVRSATSTAGPSDSVTTTEAANKELSSAAATSDAVIADKSGSFTRSVTSGANPATGLVLVEEATRTPVSTAVVSDDCVAQKSVSHARTATSTASPGTLAVVTLSGVRLVADTATSGSSVATIEGAFLSLPDSALIADELVAVMEATRTPGDTAVVSDEGVVTSQGSHARNLGDTAVVSDDLVAVMEATRTSGDTAVVSDSLVTVIEATRTPGDTAVVSDVCVADKETAATRDLADTAVVSDVTAVVKSGVRLVGSSAVPVTSMAAVKGGVRLPSSTADPSMQLATVREVARAHTAVATSGDSLALTKSVSRVLLSVAVTDDEATTTKQGTHTRAVSSGASVSTQVAVARTVARLVSSGSTPTTAVIRTLNAVRSLESVAGDEIGDIGDAVSPSGGKEHLRSVESSSSSSSTLSRLAEYFRYHSATRASLGIGDAFLTRASSTTEVSGTIAGGSELDAHGTTGQERKSLEAIFDAALTTLGVDVFKDPETREYGRSPSSAASPSARGRSIKNFLDLDDSGSTVATVVSVLGAHRTCSSLAEVSSGYVIQHDDELGGS